MQRIYLAILAASILAACSGAPSQKPTTLNVSALKAQHVTLDGKHVLVAGLFEFGSDGSALRSESSKDSIALEVPRSLDEAYRLQGLDGAAVVVSGTFDANWCSHACAGAQGRVHSIRFVRKAN